MITLNLKDVRKALNGTVVSGSDRMDIHDVIIFHQHKFKMKNTLVFIDKKKDVSEKKWDRMLRNAPCAVITDYEPGVLKGANGMTIIQVDDVREAFFKFTSYYRGICPVPVVAITGTCGKTTTREMLAHIMEENHSVVSTDQNDNAPHRSLEYLMKINERTDVGVFETGLGGPGDLRYHCNVYQPDIGIITNIGVYHLDRCKTFERYLASKAEMLEGLRNKGTLILNADDENIAKISLGEYKGKVHYFSIQKPSDFRGTSIRISEEGTRFTLVAYGKEYPGFIPEVGEHQVYNGLAALRAAAELGVDIETGIQRLSTFRNLDRHFQLVEGRNGSTIVDDTWNINPTSLKQAIKTLNAIGKGKKRIALLGGIGRLRDEANELHSEIGKYVAESNIDVLITFGVKARYIAKSAEIENPDLIVHSFTSIDGIEETVMRYLDDQSYLLIKCRRGDEPLMKLKERLMEG
ncbi:UDP-N-acetylmuramoyl-tripeptide--D-alanyl-D-alanine ligase [Rossellomorea aquimaris]|uniref:UDP-N-acetylmuramoyl-tripeptide--D-alanyl-D- alanine ligase n=1 Tax=Rossellomorea aquimaris TaxID=189382 RepID=UPI001CD48C9B|nr:UDP-N-acetylmuramoyl-tripeptide--D-alanyl-D-alanine ligase [Rossellomorea aquimaris]MCA1057185.1 UDP-N-acetylmuramoyl-tripeptide--D-alanyl-D-alanine ligase [Rossellomorea aquimaris]